MSPSSAEEAVHGRVIQVYRVQLAYWTLVYLSVHARQMWKRPYATWSAIIIIVVIVVIVTVVLVIVLNRIGDNIFVVLFSTNLMFILFHMCCKYVFRCTVYTCLLIKYYFIIIMILLWNI